MTDMTRENRSFWVVIARRSEIFATVGSIFRINFTLALRVFQVLNVIFVGLLVLSFHSGSCFKLLMLLIQALHMDKFSRENLLYM